MQGAHQTDSAAGSGAPPWGLKAGGTAHVSRLLPPSSLPTQEGPPAAAAFGNLCDANRGKVSLKLREIPRQWWGSVCLGSGTARGPGALRGAVLGDAVKDLDFTCPHL